MQVSVEVLDGLERRITVELPAARIDDEVQKRLNDMSRRIRIDGFRPGKVPVKVVRNRFGEAVRGEVTSEVIRDSYLEALGSENLNAAGGPTIEATPAVDGDTFRYLAVVEVYPEFEVSGVESTRITRPTVAVEEADIDQMLERLRKQRTQWIDVDRAAQEGDRVTMDFVGSIDGEEFAGGKAEDTPIVLGSGAMVPGFETALQGLSAGDHKHIEITFQDDYTAEHLAGKSAVFEVDVKGVAEPRLPELNDEFAAEFDVSDGGMEALRGELRGNMEGELQRAIRGRLKQQVMDGLRGSNDFELPRVLIDQEIRNLAGQAGAVETDDDSVVEITSELRQRFEDDARRRVSLGLIIAELVKSAGIEVDQRRVNAQVESLASTYEHPDQVRDWYRQNQRAMDRVRAMVLEEQVVDWVLERAGVVDEPTSFDAVMNPQGDSQ